MVCPGAARLGKVCSGMAWVLNWARRGLVGPGMVRYGMARLYWKALYRAWSGNAGLGEARSGMGFPIQLYLVRPGVPGYGREWWGTAWCGFVDMTSTVSRGMARQGWVWCGEVIFTSPRCGELWLGFLNVTSMAGQDLVRLATVRQGEVRLHPQI